jgi:hypothetical protein
MFCFFLHDSGLGEEEYMRLRRWACMGKKGSIGMGLKLVANESRLNSSRTGGYLQGTALMVRRGCVELSACVCV